MIPIDTGAEPAPLADLRARELARVRAALAAGRPLSAELLGRGWDEVRGELRTRQSFKCCWCEARQLERNRDVEHYRPKVEAIGADGVPRLGYWWLAWTWSNLFFACDGCNRYEKRSAFPLLDEGARLRPEQSPPGRERPLLLDPGDRAEHPVAHIRFRPDHQTPGRWRPVPRDGSRRGAETIRILGLDRDEVLDLYAGHVRDVDAHLGELAEAARRRADDFPARWRRACVSYLGPHAAFAALSHDLLDHRVPATLRAACGVELPRPPFTPGPTR